MSRVAVIGDVGGHLNLLVTALRELGATVEGDGVTLPDDLVVIQVGDLVHRGPDSPGVLRLVDRALREQPRQWIQLVGNHEQLYVDRPVFRWPEPIGADDAELLRRWWASGRMRPAAAFVDGGGREWLVVHGGVTAEFWRDVLRRPQGAPAAAAAVTALATSGDMRFWAPGVKLDGQVNRWSGPVWAAAGPELYASWLARLTEKGTAPPFAQVHGHSQAAPWDPARFPAAFTGVLTVDRAARHQWCDVGGVPLVGVDPVHGSQGAASWRPLVFDGATVL
ncbi:metallophosphoesterase [Pseudonocardia sp. TRM90224]|uniref:metallophosphoesterase n=1 Tax=Pseudonocardia sp. TRM90224 TaxID=2812678 RepID=UPI001E3C6078|nr:metallophosphoesterase [Pseudonocardia sp. TRM90224]